MSQIFGPAYPYNSSAYPYNSSVESLLVFNNFIAVITIYFVCCELLETLSIVLRISQYIFKSLSSFMGNPTTKILERLFRTFCKLIIGKKYKLSFARLHFKMRKYYLSRTKFLLSYNIA